MKKGERINIGIKLCPFLERKRFVDTIKTIRKHNISVIAKDSKSRNA